MRKPAIFVLLLMLFAAPATFSQEPLGDRVRSALGPELAALDTAARASVRLSPDYRIAPGDVLTVIVTGRVDLHYGSPAVVTTTETSDKSTQQRQSPDTYEVMPDGTVHLPMISAVQAAGRTAADVRKDVTEKLADYFKGFNVDVSVSKPGTIKVWVNGQVANPGPQALPSTATILEALLRSEIQSTGSTRLVRLTRGDTTRTIDVYGIVARGELESNAVLEPGDSVFVPAAVRFVTVTGDVIRPGRYEMIPPKPGAGFHVKDLIGLSMGLLPTAETSRAVIQRSSAAGEVRAIHVDLSAVDNPEMMPGDKLIVPSVSAYQPVVRLVGEFKGDDIYQREAGAVLNKSGVCRLAKGETAGDVIIRTGGTTPQADLRRAKIERRSGDKVEIIPLDLDKLITHQDRSADVVLQSGDTIMLPALVDKVYVFGQVVRPGAYPYEPDRRLIDYLGEAGGPAGRAKPYFYVVRGDPAKPETLKLSSKNQMKGHEADNPVMEPGDIVYVPQGVITDWRDLSQVISTLRLLMLF